MTDRWEKPCVHYSDADQKTCGQTPTRLYIQGPRCQQHTPSAERGRPEPPPGRCAPARCHCGKPDCPAYATYGRDSYAAQGGLAWAAVDARAVASGKRRASPGEQAAAKTTVQEQKDRDAALRRPATSEDT
ncbi:hypothetical protein [Actinomadura geliboluensis]|uniref:hypothetical protein n=1 Tax=Actinomadura geliboluensis TaxID=882440 RepID=UPI00369FED13